MCPASWIEWVMDEASDSATIAQRLEEDIVLHRILPRERLTEDALMTRFGARRHVVRKALQALASSNILEFVPHKGAQVPSFSAEEVRELYALRILLETEAARLIPLPVAPEDLARLRDAQAQHDAMVAAGDPAGVFRTNQAFHRCLFALCPNRYLVEMIESASRRAHGIRFSGLGDPSVARRARDEHHAMIAALADGWRDDLVELCRAHLPPSLEAYLRLRPGL